MTLTPAQSVGLRSSLPTSSSRWIQNLPRGRMRWPMVLERIEKQPRPETVATWRMIESPSFVALLADSTLFVAEQGDGSWTVFDAANILWTTPLMVGLSFDEARECAVLIREGYISPLCAFEPR